MSGKLLRRISAGVITATALVCGITGSFSSYSFAQTEAPDEYHDDWLHVNENAEIVDMYGNPVWLTGCNWFGYNVGSQVFDGVWSLNMHEALNQIADRGFNLLRVPMSTQLLLGWKNNEPDEMCKVNNYSNPELTIEGVEGGTVKYSFDIWNQAVAWCRENGIKIMMDVHSAETASAGHQYPVWYTDTYSTEDWLEALAWFADYYKDDDTIIAIDLKNEPHGKKDEGTFAKWDGSTDINNWRYAAERGAVAVLEKNPNLLVMVEGVEVYPKFEEGADWDSVGNDYSKPPYPYSNFHGTWWGGNFRGVREFPVDLGEHQDQLVYSPHDYGPLVYKQTWFYDGFTQETLMDDVWYDNWFFIKEEKIAPLLMGEWGGFLDAEHDEDGKNRQWMGALRDLMIEHRIHHTFWCFNENSGDTGGLIAGGTNWTEWDEEKYEFVEPSLWQNDAGKYISLDHKIPLGQSGNGISLSEHYSGSSQGTTQPTPENNTTESTETTVTTLPTSGDIVYGDADFDGEVKMNDVIKIMSHASNKEAYPLEEQAKNNCDVYQRGDGITLSDALSIQKKVAQMIDTLPES
ncbi:MAG: cellulose 1,4-beta-cellobiosidase [Ruminococcus sp.]|nr:cellulose 1,4-beta-cellobiosidase [Ruminococcus sp.]